SWRSSSRWRFTYVARYSTPPAGFPLTRPLPPVGGSMLPWKSLNATRCADAVCVWLLSAPGNVYDTADMVVQAAASAGRCPAWLTGISATTATASAGTANDRTTRHDRRARDWDIVSPRRMRLMRCSTPWCLDAPRRDPAP